MSKGAKRKKQSSLVLSSNEEEMGSPYHDEARRRKRHLEKKAHKSRSKERAKSDQEDSRSSRKIKKAVYKLSAKKEEQKASRKEETLKSSGYVQLQEMGSSSTAGAASESKTVESGQSKTNFAGLLDRLTKKEWKYKPHQKCSEGSCCKLKNPQTSHKLDAADCRDHRQGLEKKNGSSRTSCDSSNTKTRDPTSSPNNNVPKCSSVELVQDTSKNHQYYRSTCLDAKNPPTTVPEKSCCSPRDKSSDPGTDPRKWKSFTSTSENPKSPSSKSEQPPSTPKQTDALKSVSFKYRIPKKVHAVLARNPNTVSSNQNVEGGIDDSGVAVKKPESATVKRCRSLASPTHSPCKDQNKRAALLDQLPPEGPPAEPANSSFDQGQVAEELHLARSEKRLEVNLTQSYGELTAMEIDSPEEGAAETRCGEPKQKTLILVLDTNILLSHLDYVKKIPLFGLGALGIPVVLIPWVVLQELDTLKYRKGLSGSVAYLATPAISFIYTSLKKRDPHLWGQSMQQATQISNGLNTENNDDRVLQCCLQYQNMYPECAIILCTNDKNLCSKAVLSGVRAFSKADLETEARRSTQGHHFLQRVQSPVLSRLSHVSSPPPSRCCSPVQDSTGFPLDTPEKAAIGPSVNIPLEIEGVSKIEELDLSGYLHELQVCLHDVLSEVLETEMKAVFDELWLEIVYIKPPWSLDDVLQCFKKHWVAVFGYVAPRNMLKTVAKLINFFSSGETVSTVAFLQETKELVGAFGKSSKHVPNAINLIENIVNKLPSQNRVSLEEGSSAGDVVMKDDDNVDKQPATAHISTQEVWAVFEDIWSEVYQTSLEVFKALGFDPRAMQAAAPMGRPPPPQEALACLHKLSSMVAQLLEAFSRVLSSTPGLEEVQTLLSIICSNKLVSQNARLTAKDLLDCFSQPEYREKLGVGGNQLLELKKALDACVQSTGQNLAFSTPC